MKSVAKSVPDFLIYRLFFVSLQAIRQDFMKKIILFTIAVICMMTNALAQIATKTVRLKVIETSDVHGHFFPYDFMEKKDIKGTLVRANTYINKQREKYGDNLLLIDNGDILQGQPCVYWTNYVMPEDENLVASVINYMKYDAETVGNHDIEPGHKVYDKWIREVRCPLLGANIVKEEYKNAEDKDNPGLGRFILAALSQKSMVTNKIFTSGNILAGFSIDYKKKGFGGIRDYMKLVRESAGKEHG